MKLKSLILFFVAICSFSIQGQNLPPKTAYPYTTTQIHSGHSLTDPLFGNPWPGQFITLMTQLRGSWAGNDIRKSTIPGSPMQWRWDHSSGYPDARHDIDEAQLLSITEVANMCYPGGNPAPWYQQCIIDQRNIFSTWVNHAWNNGNNGNGAATLLWTNWINIDGSDGPFRLKLDTLGTEWEARQDFANANRPSGAPHVYIIPGHKMMARLYDDVQAGLVPGITNFNQFFSDNIHTNSLGDYAIAMIHYACIYNLSPVGLPNNLITNPIPPQQNPSLALATYIQNMVWDVVTSYPRTGIYTSPVTAVIAATPTSGTAPLNVSFNGSQSTNTGGGTLTYAWNFGGGQTATGVQTSHIFTNPGTYVVTLTVTNSGNQSDTETVSINVSSQAPPVAHIVATPTSGTAPLNVSFNGSQSTNTGGGTLTYAWNFGGGQTATGVQTSHIFTNPGTYVVTLTVTNSGNQSDTETVTITANPTGGGTSPSLAYEGFQYSTNQTLHGLNSGIGWSETWLVQNNNTDLPGYQTDVTNTSLSISNLQTNGAKGRGGRSWLSSGRRLNTSPTGPFSNYIASNGDAIGSNPSGQMLWFSTILQKNNDTENEISAILHANSISHCDLCPNNDKIAVGYFGTSSHVNGQKRWSLKINDVVYPSNFAISLTNPVFLVIRIEFTANNTQVLFFVNPSQLNTVSPGTPQLTQTSGRSNMIRSLAFYSGEGQMDFIDEIRLGATYESVSPTITMPPVAHIAATPTSGTAPLNVSFNGSQSTNTGGGTLTYAWNFGGGQTATGVQTSHIFTNPGTYVVTLTVTNAQNLSHQATQSIQVSPSNNNNCDYLLYEPFNYNANLPLHDLGMGTGFSGSWEVQSSNQNIPGFQTKAQNLSYQNLQNSGIHTSGGNSYLVSGRALDLNVGGAFGAYIDGQGNSIGSQNDGEVLWFSLLMCKDVNDNDEAVVELHNQSIVTYPHAPNNNRIQVGYFGTSSDVNGQRRWSLGINNTIYPSSVPITINTSALIVLRIQFNGANTIVDMYVNPVNLGNNGSNTPTLSQTSTAPLVFRSISFYGGSGPDKCAIDEIRMASTFPCVAPNPSIVFNIPPTAMVTANTTNGMAPLTINFNGSQSLNPAGGTLTYNWSFDDGNASSNLPNPSYTYHTGGGQATATLTVTDINNNTHSASIIITVLDENGTFRCLSSVTSVSQAICNGTGGHIQIHNPANTTRSLTFNGTPINPSSGNNYTNLVAGNYVMNVSGTNGCNDNHVLTVAIDSSKCANWQPQSCAMAMGTNLPGFADWEPHRATRNFMKNTRGTPIPYTLDCNCWSFDENLNNNILSQMSFDGDGYPTSLPQSTTQGNILLRYFVSSQGRNMPAGQTYVLLYDGTGNINLSGTLSGVNQTTGRIQFTLGGDGTFWYQITQSNAGNHIRNIRVVRLADEFVNLNTQPFYQGFLDKIEPFSVLRFMDWQHTNNNPTVQWSERTLPGRFSYGTNRGVPYELIIQLANQTKKDIWICVPHAADFNYITQMATLFKNQLDPNITIYLEYSNEVWNWIFTQAGYNDNNKPFDLNYGRAMALKAKNTFDIWHNVFVGEECRVKRVLGVQAGFTYLNEQILSHLDQENWDFGSPTHYFGLDHDANGVPRLDILGAAATVNDVMQNAQNNFNNFKNLVKQDYRNIQIYGKPVITYEGGQHFVGNVFGTPYPYQQSMWNAQNSPQMYNMYRMVHDSIRTWGCKLAANFSLAGPQESVYGSWGVMEHIDVQPPYLTTAARYQALLDELPPSSCTNTHIWSGAANTSWTNVCNWNNSKVPGTTSTVIIPNGVPQYPTVNTNTQIKNIILAANAALNILTGFTITVTGQ